MSDSVRLALTFTTCASTSCSAVTFNRLSCVSSFIAALNNNNNNGNLISQRVRVSEIILCVILADVHNTSVPVTSAVNSTGVNPN
eukprot:6968416-Pyramimonas_sp.AAC.1